MPNEVGKRLVCDRCGAVYLVVRSGSGTVTCHGEPATLQATKQLPSSD